MQESQQPNRLFRAAVAFRRNMQALKIPSHAEAEFLDDTVKSTFYAVIPIIALMIWLWG